MERLYQYLNDQHPHINFTIEEERDGVLPVMDVKFERRKDGVLRF